jgi:hypothetical protein
MAAPTHKPLLLLLLASACASTDVAHEPRPQTADAAKSSPAAGVIPGPVDDDLADLEASLEVYEQQLASNEARLRAMGVMVAVRDDTAPAEAEAPGRFAPPPPHARADLRRPSVAPGAYADADQASVQPRKEAEKDKKAPGQVAVGRRRQGRDDVCVSAERRAAQRRRQARRRPRGEAGRRPHGPRTVRELCELADSTCELEGKICDLAARHQGDARYAEVCRRADEDCRIAAEACTLCSP